ncbi:MAG: PAS domain S-box protein, partial [Candidatus Omnitrophica bacterium]|nr:PAS domain S-box protein [Candidatus Omnitrophota bacterium]
MKEADTTSNNFPDALAPAFPKAPDVRSSGLKSKEFREYLKKVGKDFLNFTADAEKNINLLVSICGELLGANCALYNRLEGNMLCSIGQWNVPSDFQPQDKAEGHVCYDLIMRPQNSSLIVRDLQDSIYAKTDPNVAKYNLQTYVGLPVRFNNSCIGALCAVFQEDFLPASDDLGFMELIASAIAVEENRRQVQLALRASNRRYKQICETVTDYIYTVYIKDGRAVETIHGPTCRAVTGYTPEELVADPDLWIKMVPQEDRKAVLNHAALVLSGEVTSPIEHRIIRKDGTFCWIRNTIVSHFDNEGKLLFYDGLIQDITERKKAEMALQKNQQELETIFDSASTMVFYKDRDNLMIRVNKAFAETIGFDKSQIEGKSCFELWPNEAEHYWADDKEVMASGQPKRGIIEPLVTANGPIWVATEKIPYRNEKGEVAGVIGFAIDVTYRKEAEDSLKKSEEEYRTLVDNVNIGVYRNTLDAQGRFLKVNPAMSKIFGYSTEELMEIKVSQLYQDPQDRLRFVEKIKRAGFAKNEELRLKKKDGTPIWASVTAKISLDDSGEPRWIDGVIDDVTERRQAEEEIRESEERFRALFEGATDGVLLADIETKKLHIGNSMIYKMLGYTPEEITRLTVMDIHPKDSLSHVMAQFEKQARGEIRVAKDLPIQRKDGSIFYAEVSVSHIVWDSKTYLVGSFRDVTQRKQSEEELAALNKELLKSNKRLKEFALRDQQTGLFNHRYLEEAIEAEFYRAKRY